MGAEGPGRGELAQLVPHHRLRDVDGHLLLARLVHGVDALHQALLRPRALLGRASHLLPLSSSTAAHDQRVRALALLTSPVPERRLAPWRNGVATGGVVRLAAAVRMVDRVHRDTSALRPLALVAVAAGLADLHVLVLGVRDRAHGRAALAADHSDLG